MLIAQISDTHITKPDPDEPHTLERITALKAFVAHVGKMDERPDLILHSGDVSQGGKAEEYETVKSMMEDFDIPVFFALGNRDLGANLIEGLGDLGGAKLVGGFLIYSIDGFPVRLIAMDTQKRKSNIGTTCSFRLRILEELLEEQPDSPTALFMHHPPFEVPTSKYPFQFDDPSLADAFLRLVARHEQIVHLFCGHMHRQFSVELETCNASVTPSLSPDNRLGEYEADWKERPLFQLHRWNPDTQRFETHLSPVGGKGVT
ncbi:MAG: metallophosphoesterase [Rhodospirillaceae bacterium]|nr:metallophosphoesterase [Rhodospirillaceae bacterium]